MKCGILIFNPSQNIIVLLKKLRQYAVEFGDKTCFELSINFNLNMRTLLVGGIYSTHPASWECSSIYSQATGHVSKFGEKIITLYGQDIVLFYVLNYCFSILHHLEDTNICCGDLPRNPPGYGPVFSPEPEKTRRRRGVFEDYLTISQIHSFRAMTLSCRFPRAS